MLHAIDLVDQSTKTLRNGCILLPRGRCRKTRFMIVPRLLYDKAPLVAQLNLANCLTPPGAVDFACAWIALLRCAAVLDPSSIANEIKTCRLAFSVVA